MRPRVRLRPPDTRDRQNSVAFAYATFVARHQEAGDEGITNINGSRTCAARQVDVTKGTTSEKMIDAAERRAAAEADDHPGDRPQRVVQGGRRTARRRRSRWTTCCCTASSRRRRSRTTSSVVGKYLSVEPLRDHAAQGRAALERHRQSRAERAVPVRRDRRDHARWFATGRPDGCPLNQYLKEAFRRRTPSPPGPGLARSAAPGRGRRSRPGRQQRGQHELLELRREAPRSRAPGPGTARGR